MKIQRYVLQNWTITAVYILSGTVIICLQRTGQSFFLKNRTEQNIRFI
jgi:hypothetical protein